MPTVRCPNCNRVTEIDAIRRSSTEFCSGPDCDFPLFWAVPEHAVNASSNGGGLYRGHLPGTAGKLTVGSRACKHCRDLSPMGSKHCVGCGAPFDGPDPPRTVVVSTPDPTPPAVAPVPAPEPMPWVVLALVVLAAVVAVLLSIV